MSFDWTDYLTLARALQQDPESPGPREASFRCAASRAYYAAFKCAFNYAQSDGYLPRNSGEDHKALQRHFRHSVSSDRTRKEISVSLNRLYDHRRKADYDDYMGTRPDALADQAIEQATRVIQLLAALSTAKQ